MVFFMIVECQLINVEKVIELEKSPLGKNHGNN